MHLHIPGELARQARETTHPCYAVEEGPGGIWVLSLWGALPVGWAGNLAQNCAVTRMNVRDGEAVRLTSGRWAGVFHLSPDDAGVEARQFDFAAMSLRRPRNFAPEGAMRLHKASVELDPRGGEAQAIVEAEDRLGLLGFVLAEFAALYLFPARLSVRTVGARVCDRFWLTGVGGSPPGARAIAGLERRLGALCGAEPPARPASGP